MTQQDNLNNIIMELPNLLQNLEVRDRAITDKITERIQELENRITNDLLLKISKNFENKIPNIVTNAIKEAGIVNKSISSQTTLQDEDYPIKDFHEHINSLEELQNKIKLLLKDLNTINQNKIKRFCLGFCISVAISVIISLSMGFYLMKFFPTRVVISNPQNIILQDSEVSLWGTNNTKVLEKAK